MTTYSITFTKQFSLNTDPALQPGQTRLKIVITSVAGFEDMGMLVYQIDSQTGLPYYSYPATPYDLVTYRYLTAGGLPFVRLAEFDMVYETAVLAETALETITIALQLLCTDWALLQDLETPESVTVTAETTNT